MSTDGSSCPSYLASCGGLVSSLSNSSLCPVHTNSGKLANRMRATVTARWQMKDEGTVASLSLSLFLFPISSSPACTASAPTDQ